jgi:hypothetical protein
MWHESLRSERSAARHANRGIRCGFPRVTPGRVTVATGALGVLVLVPFATSPARADVTGSYDAFASANGFSTVISNESIPTGIDIEGGGPQAQAHQTSLGIGDASAQMPYAGETVPGLPGTGAALIGLPGPPYPFIAATGRGSAPVTVSYPGLTLHAESGPFSTIGQAIFGTDASGATSDARVEEEDDGSVTSTSDTKANTLQIGPTFTVSDFHTSALATADGTDGKVRRNTTTSIGRIFAPGLVLTFPAQTPGSLPDAPITIPGAPTPPAPPPLPVLPIPAGGKTFVAPDIGFVDGYFTMTLPTDGISGAPGNKYVVPSAPVISAFKASGLTMTFQAPQELDNGVVSGAVTFDYTAAAPPQNPGVNGPTRVRQSTGAAVATVTLRPLNSGSAVTDAGTGSAGTSGATAGGGSPTGVDSAAAPGGVPALGQLPSTGTTPLDTVDLVPAAGTSQGGSSTIAFAGFSTNSINALYLVVAAIALGGLAVATALRVMGVRSRWTS